MVEDWCMVIYFILVDVLLGFEALHFLLVLLDLSQQVLLVLLDLVLYVVNWGHSN